MHPVMCPSVEDLILKRSLFNTTLIFCRNTGAVTVPHGRGKALEETHYNHEEICDTICVCKLFLDIQQDSQYHSHKRAEVNYEISFPPMKLVISMRRNRYFPPTPQSCMAIWLAYVSNFERANVFDPVILPPRIYTQIFQIYNGASLKRPISKTLKATLLAIIKGDK